MLENVIDSHVQKKALEETKAVIPGLREKITNAREKTETLLVSCPISTDRLLSTLIYPLITIISGLAPQ
jgi:hypothetical protein